MRGSTENTMSDLKKDHVLGTGASALGAGAIGAAIGAVIAGPPGAAVGAAAGTAIGAIAGHRAAESADPRGDLGHFQDVHHTMPYFIAGMTWDDYAPAYRYGIDRHATANGRSFAESEVELESGWQQHAEGSRLLWSEAREAVAHAWRELDQVRQGSGQAR